MALDDLFNDNFTEYARCDLENIWRKLDRTMRNNANSLEVRSVVKESVL
jgi:hypothetical protein